MPISFFECNFFKHNVTNNNLRYYYILCLDSGRARLPCTAEMCRSSIRVASTADHNAPCICMCVCVCLCTQYIVTYILYAIVCVYVYKVHTLVVQQRQRRWRRPVKRGSRGIINGREKKKDNMTVRRKKERARLCVCVRARVKYTRECIARAHTQTHTGKRYNVYVRGLVLLATACACVNVGS